MELAENNKKQETLQPLLLNTTVKFLKTAQMDKVSESLPSKIEHALNEPPICMVSKVVDQKTIEAFIAIELTKLKSMVNIDERLNLQSHQIPVIAASLLDLYSNESLADFKICFQRGAMGRYSGGKLFRLDGAVIADWMQAYLDEKYQAVETKLMQEKDKHGFEQTETAKDPDSWLKLWMESIRYKPQETNNEKANEFERKKIAYVPPSPEKVIERELHLQWIKENFDPISGKPLAGFKDEQAWLLDNGELKELK